MSTKQANPLAAYRDNAIDASVAAASPHQLVVMLFQGARIALAHARSAIARGDGPGRARSLAKAVAIVSDGLQASLDTTRGGPLAGELDSLYGFMALHLTQANLENDARKIEAVDALLAELESAWREIGTPQRPAPAARPETPEPRASLSYGRV